MKLGYIYLNENQWSMETTIIGVPFLSTLNTMSIPQVVEELKKLGQETGWKPWGGLHR